MTTKGTERVHPVSTTSHCTCAHATSDSRTPITNPPSSVSGNERKPPTNAAANAGTTSSVRLITFRPVMLTIRIAASVPSIDPSAQLTVATRSGEIPCAAAGALVLGDRRRRKTEARESVHDGEQCREDHADAEQDQTVAPDRHVVPEGHRVGRQELGHDASRGAPAALANSEEHGEDAEGGDQTGDVGRVAQGAHDREVRERTQCGRQTEREQPRDDGPPSVGAGVVERKGADHPHRALGEVEDTRAPVHEHDAQRREPVDRAGAEAENRELQELVHDSIMLAVAVSS